MSTRSARFYKKPEFPGRHFGSTSQISRANGANAMRRNAAAVSAWALRICILALMVIALVSRTWAGPAPTAAPVIVAISPVSLTSGSTGVTLTVEGGGFVQTSVVQWNGAPLTTTYVSAIKLTATVPDLDVSTNSTASVTVSNARTAGTPLVSNTAYLPISKSEATINFGSGISTTRTLNRSSGFPPAWIVSTSSRSP